MDLHLGLFSIPDLLALGVFVFAWFFYAITVEHLAIGKRSLNARMNEHRAIWMRNMLARDMRMTDMQIMTALQNGTAFFASTTIFAIGGALTLLRSSSEILQIMALLPIQAPTSPALWEIKNFGLIVIFVYAFFKFAWSYRLFNYVAIMLGATPPHEEKDSPHAQAHLKRTIAMFQSAATHFNRGQRGFFLALGYLGWFISPWLLIITTIGVVYVMWRRQFASDSWRAMAL